MQTTWRYANKRYLGFFIVDYGPDIFMRVFLKGQIRGIRLRQPLVLSDRII